jgi:hypothetical protein
MERDESPAPRPRSRGPGPFVTLRLQRLPSGRHRVATSRRHRKGLPPHEVATPAEALRAPPTPRAAFHHLFAPRRLGWWIAVLFAIGSTHFLVGALAATWPELAPAALRRPRTLGAVFFAGSLFFTGAAWLQWLEAVNGDVATALEPGPRRWRWFGWLPRNLGYLACLIQLAGTLLFNVDTADAMIAGLPWRQEDLVVWTPDMLGSICFLVSSYLAFAEVSHAAASFAPRSVSWWIAAVNLVGSAAFQLSAFDSVVGPAPSAPSALFWSSLLTALGALCFLVGAYLLVPELFDTDREDLLPVSTARAGDG